MAAKILKKLALHAISAGIRAPESEIGRYLELVQLRGLLQTLEINCVLDVGANKGQFAGELRSIGYRGHIISFEPMQKEFRVLQETFQSDSQWSGHQLALGSENGVAQLNVIPDMTVLSSMLTPVCRQPTMTVEKVQVRRLDSMFADLTSAMPDPRIFLKMDTQGYDIEVFKGAGDSMRHICGLQSEISVSPLYKGMPHYLEALAIYEKAGFELFNLTVVSRTPSGLLQELNCFMTRKATRNEASN